MIAYEDFEMVDVRVGRIVDVQDFPQARNPSYKLKIDLGLEIGFKKSCAQLPANYSKDELDQKLVLCVVNFPPRQIGPALSEVLTLGVPDGKGDCLLVAVDGNPPLGGKLY